MSQLACFNMRHTKENICSLSLNVITVIYNVAIVSLNIKHRLSVFHPVSPPRCHTFTTKCDSLASPSSATSLPFLPHWLSPQSPGHAASTEGSSTVLATRAPTRVTAASTGGVWAQPLGSTYRTWVVLSRDCWINCTKGWSEVSEPLWPSPSL